MLFSLGLVLVGLATWTTSQSTSSEVISVLQELYTTLDGDNWRWYTLNQYVELKHSNEGIGSLPWNFTILDVDHAACNWTGIHCNDAKGVGISSINAILCVLD